MSYRSVVLLGLTVLALAACGPRRETFDVPVVDVPPGDLGVDASMSCTAPQIMCGSSCINAQTDRDNCGACGHACPTGESCTAGTCALQCPSPESVCGGLCVNTSNDRFNCGACGTACPAGQVCSTGHCALDCASGLLTCSSAISADAGADGSGGITRYCADVRVDRNNCGSCSHACPAGENCVSGTCTASCPAGQMLCGTQCIDLMTDPAHCGSCANACPGGQTCTAGTCSMMCPASWTYCTDRCVNTQSDRTNCGACGHACTTGEVCAAGTCAVVCPTGTTNCSGTCIATGSDRLNCGACGTVCPSGQVCSAGACAATCAPGTMSCGGNCVDATTDRSNCGSCGTACATGQFCVGGACGASCLAGQTVCGGICVNLATDPANCGYCGGACGAGYACAAGYCRPLTGTDASGCSPPSRQCGPTCTDVRSDNNNCGACGTACSSDRTCSGGMCLAPCAAGEVRCGTTCTRVLYDRNNCGTCGNACAGSLSCSSGVCVPDPTFRVTGMVNTGCVLSNNEETQAGDDCGGLAVGNTQVFYTGDSRTVTLPASDLTTITTLSPPETPGRYIAVLSDTRSGDVYTLLDATGAVQPTASFSTGSFTITQLGLLDPTTGNLTTTRVGLSMPITFGTSGAGIYSGFGRAIVFNAASDATRGWYNIDLPTGLVRAINVGATVNGPPGAAFCETFAHWGIAEYFGGDYHVLYVRNSGTPVGVIRFTPSTGMADTTPVLDMMGSSGDICMVAFAPARNRWYFHYEAAPTWAPPPAGMFGEFVGYCPGTWDAP